MTNKASTMNRFSGKRAIVTGASSGIGRAVAERLAREGARVALLGRDRERLDATLRTVSNVGSETGAFPVIVDHVDPAMNAKAAADALEGLGGKVDVLVNAAGIIANDGIVEAKPETFDRVMQTNLTAVYDFTRHIVPAMVRARTGNIVNISSVCGTRPYPNIMSYCVSKAALDMMTQCLALELAPHGIRVNAVNPGVVRSGLHTTAGSVGDYDAFLERAKSTHPLGRHGEPNEIAALCAHLASDEAGWITGGLFPIDGGRALTSLR